MFSRYIHIISLWLLTFPAIAQVSFSVQPDTNRMLIGEQIKLTLKAEFPEDDKVNWPFLADSLAGFEIVKKGTLVEEYEGGIKSLIQEIWLTSFDSGYAFIPALSIQLGEERLESQAIGILVSVPEVPETEDYYDIKEPIDPPLNWPLIIGLILLFIALGVLIYWLIGKFQKGKRPAALAPEASMSPYEWALTEIEQLRRQQIWKQGKVKEYYSQVTDVMRRYIERQMHQPAMESTAYEVVEIIRGLKPGDELMERCENLMELSIGVKYARQTPTESDHHAALTTLEEFIEAYKPIEEEKEEDVSVSV